MQQIPMRALVALLLLVAGVASASAQDVTPAERDRALQYLESTKQNVLDARTFSSAMELQARTGPLVLVGRPRAQDGRV